MHLALACDLVVMADTAKFIEVFVRRGIMPDAGGAYLLPRLVGLHRAKELLFLGDDCPAAEADRIGLVNRVVPAAELDAAVDEIAAKFLTLPTRAISLTKRLANRSFESSREQSFSDEADFQELVSATADMAEGLERLPRAAARPSSRAGSGHPGRDPATMSNDEPLGGGMANPGAVFRRGDSVVRPAPPSWEALHPFLRGLRAEGFVQAPVPTGPVVDGRRAARVHARRGARSSRCPSWADDEPILASVGTLLRKYHAAAGGVPFDAGAPLVGRAGRPPGRAAALPQRRVPRERRVPRGQRAGRSSTSTSPRPAVPSGTSP